MIFGNPSQHRRLWIAVTAAALGLCSCHHPTKAPLRIGLNPWPPCGFLYLAQELGYLQQEGCNVRLLSFSSLADVQRAYVRNQLQGMYGTPIEWLHIRDLTAHRPQIVQVTDISRGADVLLAQPEYHSIAQLKGTRIGCEPGSVSTYLLICALQQAGLGLTDVTVISCDQYRLRHSFESGDFDAVVTYPPVSVDLAHRGNVLFSSREMHDEVLGFLMIDDHLVAQRPDEIAGLIRAYDRALQYARNHPRQASEKMASYLCLSPADLEQVLRDDIHLVRLADQQEQLNPSRLRNLLRQIGQTLAQSQQLLAAPEPGDCVSLEPARLAAEIDSRTNPD